MNFPAIAACNTTGTRKEALWRVCTRHIPAEAAEVKFGGDAHGHHVVLLYEVHRHVADGAAGHHHPCACVCNALDQGFQSVLLTPAVTLQLLCAPYQHCPLHQTYGRHPSKLPFPLRCAHGPCLQNTCSISSMAPVTPISQEDCKEYQVFDDVYKYVLQRHSSCDDTEKMHGRAYWDI